jgi:hypothetical protein
MFRPVRVSLFHDIAGIIPKALGASQCVNQGPAGNCLEAPRQSSVKEAVARPLEERICDLIHIPLVKVLYPLVLR